MSKQDQWASVADIKNLRLKRWQQGLFLCEAIETSGLFPLRLPLKQPSSQQLGEDYDLVKVWVQYFQQAEKTKASLLNGESSIIGNWGVTRYPLPLCLLRWGKRLIT